MSALGVFTPFLNGSSVGDHVLDPGWTSYGHRICSSSFDVTDLVVEGDNVLAVLVADGWYRGRLGYGRGTKYDVYGARVAILGQLEIDADDNPLRVVTDTKWRAAQGPILASSIYDGETWDFRADLPGWTRANYDDSAWNAVEPVLVSPSVEPMPMAPVRRTGARRPDVVSRSDSSILLDFGQNLVGWIRFEATGRAGDEIVVRHAEVLQDGALCVYPLRTAKATDTFILAGRERQKCEPCFTFHGFRYAELSGAVGSIDLDSVEAVVIHSDLERTGWFESSDPDLDRLHENVVWSMRGNFVSLPTDCPQRDERMGWTGDIQVFAPTACFVYDVGGFLSSWLTDLALEQLPNGAVPNVIPDLHIRGSLPDDEAAAAWGDAATVVPWALYQRLGDKGVLERNYEGMKGWVGWVESRLSEDDVWDSGWQYGDWLDPAAPADSPHLGLTEPALVATAYAIRSSDILAGVARMLDGERDGVRYEALADRVRAGFDRRFVTGEGRLTSDSPTAYALAICFRLVKDDSWRTAAGARLAHLVKANGFRIATGFVGTPIVCDALCETGHEAEAWQLVLERSCPSWLYPVTMGATTIWERWDSMLPDGSVNTGSMTSFNHYAFGAIADWLHRYAAGLSPATPGYQRIRIRPRPAPQLTRAAATLRTPYGNASVEWVRDDQELRLRATVPPNAEADVFLPLGPAHDPIVVGSGTHNWSVPVIRR